MVWKLRSLYPDVVYDLMNRGDQREAFFGDGQPRLPDPVFATGERNRQVQSATQSSLET